MRYGTAILLLLSAALLEAGGDALIRLGLRSPTQIRAILLVVLGGIALTVYGCTVNGPPWNFGRLLGTYIVFFFLLAQLISWAAFGQRPTLSIFLGGALILVGGWVVSMGF